MPGQNAMVLETEDPREFLAFFRRMGERPDQAQAMRRAGQSTARSYTWQNVVDRVLLPRVEERSYEPVPARRPASVSRRNVRRQAV